jgi:uncharacterized membrane protein
MSKKTISTNSKSSKGNNMLLIVGVVLFALVLMKFGPFSRPKGDEPLVKESNDLKISVSEVTKEAKFYSYQAGDTYIEFFAVRADDGTIRTALNTCQVCYNSGRGYYRQQGDTVICQNCRNVFGVNNIEIIKGGCNPIPITAENKTEDEEYITISKDFIESNQRYFSKWKN